MVSFRLLAARRNKPKTGLGAGSRSYLFAHFRSDGGRHVAADALADWICLT